MASYNLVSVNCTHDDSENPFSQTLLSALPRRPDREGAAAVVAAHIMDERMRTKLTTGMAPLLENGGSSSSSQQKRRNPITDNELAENGAEVFEGNDHDRHVHDKIAAADCRPSTQKRLRYVWRQSRDQVTVVIPTPSGVRAGDVTVTLKAKPDTYAEGVADLIRVTVVNRTTRGKWKTSVPVAVGDSENNENEQVGVEGGNGMCSGRTARDQTAEMEMTTAGQENTESTADEVISEEELVLLSGELPFQVALEEEVDWELKDFPGTRVASCNNWLGFSGAAPTLVVAAAAAAAALTTTKTGQKLETTTERKGGGGLDFQTDSGASIGQMDASERPSRGVQITLRKHCPIPNAVVWWRSFVKGEPEIDISSIKGRAKNNGYQSAWEEAMGMFKAKMADRKEKGKISVDIGDH